MALGKVHFAQLLGCDENKRQGGGNEALDDKSATMFRRSAAMLNYMAQDRLDLSFASKEVSRGIAKPTQEDVVKLKRIIRYLSEAKRMTSNTNGRVHRTRSLRTVTVIGLAAPRRAKVQAEEC